MRPTLRITAFIVTLLAASCGGNLASQIAKPPEFLPKDQTQCAVVASHAKPLVVEWPSADRGQLEAHLRNQGLVAVEYSGCNMRVLDRCTGASRYTYAPITKKTDRVVMRDADDLYANVPVGAAKLEAKLAKTGELNVEMTLVGRWENEPASLRVDQLRGECAGATHVVTAVTVGAFTFTAGVDTEVGGGATVLGAGGGAKSSSRRETLSSDGVESACEKATLGDRAPPDECGAVIRLEVVPLAVENPFLGRWMCTETVTANAADGSTATVVATVDATVADNGDGTMTETTRSRKDGKTCSKRLVASGNDATLVGTPTCQTDRVSVTATSGHARLTGGTITSTASGTGLVDGKTSITFAGSGTCTRP